MACVENICCDLDCGFHEFSNELLKECPLCGGPISNFFDEESELPTEEDYGRDLDE